jgi:hypothetical protein
MIRRTLLRFAKWVIYRYQHGIFVVPPAVEKILPRTLALCEEISRRPTPSGEFRRMMVYGRLQKEFPEMRHKDLGLAIELVVHDV